MIKYPMILLVFTCAILNAAKGQGSGMFQGTVEDPSGAPIGGAEVRLRSQASAQELVTKSDEEGEFEFRNLPFDTYLVTVTVSGFDLAERTVEVGTTPLRPLKIRLKVAQLKGEVRVNAQADAPSAQQNLDYVELDQGQLQNLPVKEGDPLAVPSLFLDPAVEGAQGPKLIVDGVESSTLELPLASIKEVYVNRSPYSAEFGRPGKGRLEVITRRGSRHHYRGLASLLLRNSAVDARNPFAKTLPQLQRGVGEGQLSGPLVGHTTFFIAGRYFHSNKTAIVSAQTPTGSLKENFPVPERSIHGFARLDFQFSRSQKGVLSYKYKDKNFRNQNVGGFNLPERATDVFDRENEVRFFETSTVSDRFLNEFRFTYKEQSQGTNSLTSQNAIVVLGAFSGGGAQISRNQLERVANIQDIATVTKGIHVFHFGGGLRPRFFDVFDASDFGGTFTFSSLAAFTANSPYRFDANIGSPRVSFSQHEFFSFFEDEMRLRQNLSLSLGLRHEFQSRVDRYKNLGPRLALAYAPGNGLTVLRAGAGIFYDRQPDIMQQQALLLNGTQGHQVVIACPTNCPTYPVLTTPPSLAIPSIVRIASDIRLPYLIQGSFAIERRLGRGRNFLTVDYTTVRGVGLYRTRNVNAPLPTTGLPPDPNFINIDQFESSGSSRANSLALTFQGQLRQRFNLLAQYTLSRSMDDTSGMFSLPADNYNLRPEWGRSDFDRRHRLNIVGTYRLPFGFRAGTVISVSSGPPFNITTGFDNNNDTVANDRPPGVTRNTGHGPGYADVDLHFAKKITFERHEQRPGMEIGIDAFNLFNHVNFQDYVGTLTSPFFGRANAANPARELQLSVKIDF